MGPRSSGFCEVFDSFCNKFVLIRAPSKTLGITITQAVVLVGRRIVVYGKAAPVTAHYDVDENKWTEEVLDDTKNIRSYKCLKIPKM